MAGRQRGFTIMEVIVTLVILGIIGVFGAMFMASGMRGFFQSRLGADVSMKAQIALDRISLELRYAKDLSAPGAIVFTGTTAIQYTSDDANLGGIRQLFYTTNSTSGALYLDPGTGTYRLLVDGLSAFNATATMDDLNGDGMPLEVYAINLDMTFDGVPTIFSLEVLPRNPNSGTFVHKSP